MTTNILRIPRPELFLGFVSPIGTDLQPTLSAFTDYFSRQNYRVVTIKVTDIFPILEKYVPPMTALRKTPLYDRYISYINYGNHLRSFFGDNAVLAASAISNIIRYRLRTVGASDPDPFATVFLIHQFKRKEEIELLRSVYGRLFFQISIYARRGTRVDYLSQRFAESTNDLHPNRFRHDAEKIILDDENQEKVPHGQRVGDIFHDADFIVNSDVPVLVNVQIERFCDLLFGSNSISPSKYEYGMYLAKAAAYRTLDLSRQVGAAIFSRDGEIISLGSNEVPRAGGGTYWHDDRFDDRDYVRGFDSNSKKKQAILNELLDIFDKTTEDAQIDEIRNSQFMDVLEFGRMIHAEMSSLMDAARIGRSVKDAVLYCTTFPCHMCAKHIVASGISKVVFLEPYPKSLAADLHADSIEVEGSDRGRYKDFPSVRFEHFYGVTPRRFRMFERSRRKDASGRFRPYIERNPTPIVDIKRPLYNNLEEFVQETIHAQLQEVSQSGIGIFSG